MRGTGWEHLMQEALDGVASPEERRRLEAHLETDPAARLRYRELKATFGALDALAAEDPSPDIVANALQVIRQKGEPDPARVARDHAAGSRATRALRYAFAFAAGAAMAVLVVTVLPGGRALWSGMEFPGAGSLAAPPAARPGELLDRRELAVNGARVLAETRNAAGQTRLWIRAHADQQIEIALSFDPRALRAQGLQWEDGADPAIRTDPGRIVFRHEGEGTFRFAFVRLAPEGTLIHIEVRFRGESIGNDLMADRSTGGFDDSRVRGTGLVANFAG